MNREELFENIKRKESFLCVGLDTDVTKIPEFLFDRDGDALDPVFEFNKNIIDATADLCVAYKPNIAFYESLGVQGWDVLERTVDYILTSLSSPMQNAATSETPPPCMPVLFSERLISTPSRSLLTWAKIPFPRS